jgi:hypothetical protein
MQVRFTISAEGQSYQVIRAVRPGVAVEAERSARAFARKLGSNSYGVAIKLLTGA